MKIGVLASQGAFAEHILILNRLDVEAVPVRLPRELRGVDAERNQAVRTVAPVPLLDHGQDAERPSAGEIPEKQEDNLPAKGMDGKRIGVEPEITNQVMGGKRSSWEFIHEVNISIHRLSRNSERPRV